MSQRSSRVNEGSVRPKIFDEWPKNTVKFMERSSYEGSKYRQTKRKESLRAEETLFKTLMLESNIRNFIAEKDEMSRNYELYGKKSLELKRKLEYLSTERGEAFNEVEYENCLKEYFTHIRKETNFIREAQGFSQANLANHDANISSMKFTRTKGESHKELLSKLNLLNQKRNRVQEALVVYEEGIPKSEILCNEFDLDSSLDDLSRFTSEDKLIEIHYLMLYEISDIEEQFKAFSNKVQSDHENYSMYEALNDSMGLMIHQKEEMKKDRKQMQKTFTNLTMENSSNLVPSSRDSLAILMKNQEVYDSNTELLARYNAETNLNEYSNRRKNYISELSKFKTSLEGWKGQQGIAALLYSSQQTLENFNKKKSITNQTYLKSEKEGLRQAYYDCFNCQIPKNMIEMQNYRSSVVSGIESAMEREGVIVPGGNEHYLKNKSSLSGSSQELQKSLNFFMELENKPIPEKCTFLRQQKNNINALQYELSNSNHSNTMKNHLLGLSYCGAIAENEETFQGNQYIGKVEQISQQGWRGLPIGIDSLAFFYSYDVLIKNEGNNYITKTFESRLAAIGQKIEQELLKYKQKNSINQIEEITTAHVNLTPEERRTFFFSFYHKISDYSPIQKAHLLNCYWGAAEKYIVQAFVNSNQITKTFEIEKKNFFTFSILSYLATEGKKLQVSNLDELIYFYVDKAENEEYYKWSQNKLFLEIIKQRILLNYIKQKSNFNTEFKKEVFALESINEAFTLQYEINDHIALANTDVEAQLEHSIKLQKSWNKLRESVNESKDPLLAKCREMIMSTNRSPLQLGTRSTLKQIEPVMNVRGKIGKLRLVNNLKENFGFLATVYTRAHNFLTIIDNLPQNFTSSETIAIANQPNKALYLSELEKFAIESLSLMKPQFYEIIGIFRGKETRGSGSRAKLTNENEIILNEIIGKLEKQIKSN